MGRTFTFSVVGICVLTGALWVFYKNTQPVNGISDSVTNESYHAESMGGDVERVSELSPFSTNEFIVSAETSKDNAESLDLAEDKKTHQGAKAHSWGDIDITSVGRERISDDEFLRITNALRNDPDLLQLLIDELRQETDSKRRARIARLLGEVGGDSVTLTASELIYSSDSTDRKLGLNLLQRIQPGNAAAREIASSLLATEVDPQVLVDTLSTLSRPSDLDENSREFLSDQLIYLTSHSDTSVRSISISVLSRWSEGLQNTEVLQAGLSDDEPTVRESAAYALVDHKNVSQSLIDALLVVAVDPEEYARARRGAILALKSMSLDTLTLNKVLAAELQLNVASR